MNEAEREPNQKGIFLKKKFVLIAIPLILILVSPPLYYFYREYNKMYDEYQKTKLQINKSSSVLGSNIQSVIDKVNKLIELPEETPTVANVTDAARLKNQPFFAKAKNGDTVLIFPKAKKAIIYREAINKIIEVGAINIETPSVTPGPSVTPAFRLAPEVDKQ